MIIDFNRLIWGIKYELVENILKSVENEKVLKQHVPIYKH